MATVDENGRPRGADDAPAAAMPSRRASAEPDLPAVEGGTPTRVVRARKAAPTAPRKTLKDADEPVPAELPPPSFGAAPGEDAEQDARAARHAAKTDRDAGTTAARELRERAKAERDAEEAALRAEVEIERAEREAAKEAERAQQAAAKTAADAERTAAREAERAQKDAAREAERTEREAAKEAERAEREAAKEAERAEKAAAKAAADAERTAAREAERAGKDAAREAERAEKAAAKAAAEAERQAAKDAAAAQKAAAKAAAETERREARLAAKAEKLAAQEAERSAKAAAKAKAKADKAAARAARRPKRDLRPQPFPVVTASDWERPAEAATTLFKRAEFTATEAVDWYLRHKRSRKRASRLLRALAILLVVAGMLVPLLAPAIDRLRPEYGFALFALAASCVAFDYFFGLSSGWMRDVVTAQALHTRLEALRFEWAAECARSALTTRRTMDEVDRQLTLLRDFSDDVVALTTAETQEWMAEFRLNVASARQRMAARGGQARRGAHSTDRPS